MWKLKKNKNENLTAQIQRDNFTNFAIRRSSRGGDSEIERCLFLGEGSFYGKLVERRCIVDNVRISVIRKRGCIIVEHGETFGKILNDQAHNIRRSSCNSNRVLQF